MQRSKRFMRPLRSDIHFYTAQMERSLIVVFAAGELVGSGRIEDITNESIKIRGDYYLRKTCIFKTAK
ncbi:hypothetical protein D1872_341500 [compost metagenome]